MTSETLKSAWDLGRRVLEKACYSPTPALDARVLLCHCAGVSREYYYAHREDHHLTSRQYDDYLDSLRFRLARKPVAYITGCREFMGLNFYVNPSVLIPRPATETLVEAAIDYFSREKTANPVALEIGTGSGCVAVSLAYYVPGLTVYGVDISPGAIATAGENIHRLNKENPQKEMSRRIHLLEGNLYGPVMKEYPGRFDLVISNPPYVTGDEWQCLAEGVRNFEPREALVPQSGAGEIYYSIISGSLDYLSPGGALMLEIGADMASMVTCLFSGAGFSGIQVFRDLEGHDRVVTGRVAHGTLT